MDRPRLSALDKSCARVAVEASAGEDSLEARGQRGNEEGRGRHGKQGWERSAALDAQELVRLY